MTRTSVGAVPDFGGVAMGRTYSSNNNGIRVEQVEVPYHAADVDHHKTKTLDYMQPTYEFSSPFAFSQGDANSPSSTSGQSALPAPCPAPGPLVSYGADLPRTIVTETYTSYAVSDMSNIHGVSQHTTEAHYRPPMQGYGQPPPQYPQQQYYAPPGPQYGGPPQMMQPYPQPQPGYGAPPPGRLEGWLAKRSDAGMAGAWNARYWRIEGQCLIYSRDEQSTEAGRIEMTAKTEIRPLNIPQASVEGRMMASKKPCAFEIYQGPGMRTYYLDAGSPQKKQVWIQALQGVVAQMRQGGWTHGGPPVGGFCR